MPDPIQASLVGSPHSLQSELAAPEVTSGPSSSGDATCDATKTCCAPQAAPLTLPEVVIVADPGARLLIDRYEAPACKSELVAAATSCVTAVAGAAAMVASAPTGVGLVLSSVGTVGATLSCYRLVAAYDDCRELGSLRAQRSNECLERGGMPVPGVEPHEVVCLVPNSPP